MHDKDIAVVYHGKCPDGFGAAWVAWKKFGNRAQYIPYFYSEPLEVQIKDKQLFFVDVVPPEDDLQRFISENKSVVAIDHHQTNETKIRLVGEHVFDLKKSGCVLTWEYFYPTEPVPKLLQYIQDMDMWQWKLDNSKEINAILRLYDFDFSLWSQLAADLEDPIKIKKHIVDGSLIEKYEQNVVTDTIENNRQLVEFEGYQVYAINSSLLSNQIGNILYIEKPPLAIIWKERSDIITVSLRSDRSVDVATIAQKYGGGGHKGAAGFELKLGASFPWRVLSNKHHEKEN